MPKLIVLLIATLAGGAVSAHSAVAQSAQTSATSTDPVAYVYVTRPTHLDGFAVAPRGKLTALPGSPYPGISLYYLTVNKKFLFGAGDDHTHIFTYSIASNGAVKEVESVDATMYSPDGAADCCFNPQTLDRTGATLYNMTDDAGDQAMETFKVESSGALQFIGNTPAGAGSGGTNFEPGMISFLGNNQFAYQTGCDEDVPTKQLTAGYKRGANGLLQPASVTVQLPPATSGDVYCPFGLATAPYNHLAFAVQLWNADQGEADGPFVLASYTADANGNLTTKRTVDTMPSISARPLSMSISPSGKLLAISLGSGGFQVFHFNGSYPITKFTGVRHSSETFLQFGWDQANHLYALSTTNLHVYSATSSGVTEVAGSPYSIPEASSLAVRAVQ